jgi:hypothetical protein
MNPTGQDSYKVWDNDNTVYGPVGLSHVIEWIRENRILPETFIHAQSEDRWYRAQDLESLREHFSIQEKSAPHAAHYDKSAKVDPAELRQFAIFSELTDDELEQFASLGDFYEIMPETLVVRQGDDCDAVYFVLSGVLRVRLLVGVPPDDTTLCKISGGEFFGEMGMFLQSTRTADVISESAARLFRMPTNAFQLLVRQMPELAAPILYGIATALARRMAEDNNRFYHEVTSQFLWR